MSGSHASPEYEHRAAERVFVSGVGVISTAGLGPARTWAAALGRGLPATPLPSPLDRVLPQERCARISPELEASPPGGRGAQRFLSGAARHFVVCAQQALSQSQLANPEIQSFGIAVGSSNGERSCREALRPFLGPTVEPAGKKVPRRSPAFRPRGPAKALQTQPGLIAGNLAIACGAGGPVLTFINDGLASGIALGEALRTISSGACPGMLAGGTSEADDPWLLLARRESRREDAPALPWTSAAACLVMETLVSLHERRVTPLAEFLGYWSGKPASALRDVDRACRGLDLVAVLCNAPQRLRETSLSLASRSGEATAPWLAADCLAASQALYAALAVHALRQRGSAQTHRGRRAVLCLDFDSCGGCTVLLLAEAPIQLDQNRGK